MRWRKKVLEEGETRVKRGFLFFPKTINNETRWLEYATWREHTIGQSDGCGSWFIWGELEWVDYDLRAK